MAKCTRKFFIECFGKWFHTYGYSVTVKNNLTQEDHFLHWETCLILMFPQNSDMWIRQNCNWLYFCMLFRDFAIADIFRDKNLRCMRFSYVHSKYVLNVMRECWIHKRSKSVNICKNKVHENINKRENYLEGVHIAKSILYKTVDHQLGQSQDLTTQMEGIAEPRLLSLLMNIIIRGLSIIEISLVLSSCHNRWLLPKKGPGSIKGFFGLRFSENLKFLILHELQSHNKGNMP